MTKAKENTSTRIIALISSPRDFVSTFEQLKNRNLSFSVVASVDQALKLANTGAFSFCLISVDFTGIDTSNHPAVFEKELNVPVIAISELRDRNSMSRLSKTKVKNILYSKATAQSIWVRIELMRKTSKESKAKAAAKLKVGTVTELSRTSETGKVVQRQILLTPPLNFKFKFTPEIKFKIPPKTAALTPTSFEDFLSSSELQAVNSSSDSQVVAVSTELPIPYQPLSQDDTQASVLTSLKNVLVRLGPETKVSEISDQFSSSLVISFNSPTLVGTFVIAQQEKDANLNTVESELYLQLRSAGFVWTPDQVSVQHLHGRLPSDFVTAGVYVSKFCDIGEVAITYYSERVIIPKFAKPEGEEFIIDLRDLTANSKVSFDLFINLKLNSRSLHYLKVGNVLSAKQIDKLKIGGIEAWVPATQLVLFEQYVLFQRLMKLMREESMDEEVETLLRFA